MSGLEQATSNVARAFGVRRLDAAFTFGRSDVRVQPTVKRVDSSLVFACDTFPTLHNFSDARKSGVKPPHSKASRHSQVASFRQHLDMGDARGCKSNTSSFLQCHKRQTVAVRKRHIFAAHHINGVASIAVNSERTERLSVSGSSQFFNIHTMALSPKSLLTQAA